VLGQLLTPRSVTNTIIEGLNGWREGIDTKFNARTSVGMLGTLQTEMGWKHFFEGRLHHRWREHMTTHYKNTGERKSGKRWISALIRKLWEIAWDLWEHRNGVLHDRINGYANQTLTEKINNLWKHPLLKTIPSIKYLLKDGEDAIQGRTQHQKQQWVARVEVAVQQYSSMRDSTAYHQEREGMRRYLNQFRK
jgi:hypothetical protein